MKQHLFVACILIIIGLSAVCYGWGQTYRASEPIGVVSGWPGGLRSMANSPLRTGGLVVNFSFEFIYEGTTEQLNEFLRQHAALEHSVLWVTVHEDSERRSLVWGDKLAEMDPAFDWKLTVVPQGRFTELFDNIPAEQTHIITVDIWLDEGIEKDALKIPANTPEKPSLVDMPSSQQSTQKPGISDADIVRGNTAFAFDLYARLKAKEGNLFYSPYSISTALAMTNAGAKGETKKQIQQTLHFPASNSMHNMFDALFGRIMNQLNRQGQKGDYQLSVANALWAQKDYPFLNSYIVLNKSCYRAGLENVDFINETEQTRQQINDWVEDKTQDKIKELIPDGILNEATRLVLTNAIYFKGDWALKFDSAQTKDELFYITPEKTVTAPLMHQKEDFRYTQIDGMQLLELPYKGEDLSMLVLLPDKESSLAALEKRLTADNLTAWQKSMRKKEVLVYLPRFKMTHQFDLSDTLGDMGMAVAFTPAADFSGITTHEGLFISDVVHKAFVEVNEEGTEAAAATGVAIRLTAMPTPPPVFRADRPFVFIIKDNKTNSILFIGRIINPTKEN